MSMRLTLGNLRDPNTGLGAKLNICPTDPRFARWANNFQERALNLGRWWGTTQLVRFCITDKCLVAPREVACIEAANLNGVPIGIGNSWFQFLRPHVSYSQNWSGWPAGSGGCGCGCGCSWITLNDQLTKASFSTTTGQNKKLRIYPGNNVDSGKKIIFQGNDKNGIWVRSTFNGARQDGEQVTLALPFVETTTIWGPGAPEAVLKDVTDYRVLVYELNTDTGDERLIADYQPGETRPMYRAYKLEGLGCRPFSTGTGCCSQSTLLTVCSLQHVPVNQDNDWMLFQNLTAYSDGMLAEKYYEEGNVTMGDLYFYGTQVGSRNGRGVLREVNRGGAIPNLQAELRKMTGDKTTIQMNYDGVYPWQYY